jgi:hypothetical protein
MSKASTPKTRLQRTSNPTPPEPESSKKYKIDMSQNNPDVRRVWVRVRISSRGHG